MSVLVYIESSDKQIKKSSLEAVSCAADIAKQLGVSVVALAIGDVDNASLVDVGKAGASKVLYYKSSSYASALYYAEVIAATAKEINAGVVLLSKSSLADSILARLSAKLGTSAVAGVSSIQKVSASELVVTKSIYTGKAFASVSLTSAVKVFSLSKNACAIKEDGAAASVEEKSLAPSAIASAIQHKSEEKASGDILLTEADIVVSGGRGLKGPENWGMIEELAKLLGAATGCSKPVSDLDWRPHHEHVGQTGVKVSPNLYIAVGISGAIQHLAGVSSSKVIVVINKDPEAPFFKAADYGIVGDAFDVIPKLIEAAKKM